MADHSLNGHLDQGKIILEVVWYESNAALAVGEAVCYNYDYGTSTDREASRYNRVETPSTTNAQHFAGVAACAYAAVSTGQFIEIYKPGSVCLINVAVSTEVGVGLLTFDVTAGAEGQFRYEGLPGAGSAIPLEETTYVATAQSCLAYLTEGPQSGGVEVVQIVANTAWAAMVGGTTLIIGVASGSSSPTEEVLDGTVEGLYKKVEVITTAITTNEAALDIENNDGITLAGGALASLALGVVGDQVVLKWSGAVWRNMASVGVTES